MLLLCRRQLALCRQLRKCLSNWAAIVASGHLEYMHTFVISKNRRPYLCGDYVYFRYQAVPNYNERSNIQMKMTQNPWNI